MSLGDGSGRLFPSFTGRTGAGSDAGTLESLSSVEEHNTTLSYNTTLHYTTLQKLHTIHCRGMEGRGAACGNDPRLAKATRWRGGGYKLLRQCTNNNASLHELRLYVELYSCNNKYTMSTLRVYVYFNSHYNRNTTFDATTRLLQEYVVTTIRLKVDYDCNENSSLTGSVHVKHYLHLN